MPVGIYTRTDKHRENMSLARIGQTPWNKGVFGYSTSRKGGKHTEETKQRMKEACKGKISPMQGKKHTEETKRKISLSHIGKPAWNKKEPIVMICANCDKEFEVPVRRQFKAKYCSRNCKGSNTSPEEKKRLKEIGIMGTYKVTHMNEPTSIEKKIYEELKARGILFEKQKLINGKFVVDAYIPSLNLVIEADGEYWHSSDKAQKKDKAENAYLTKCGFNLLRLSGTEIKNGEFMSRLPN